MKKTIRMIMPAVFLVLLAVACAPPGADTNGENGNGNGNGNGGEEPAGITSKWELWTGGTHLRGANIYQRRVYPELDGGEFMGAGVIGPPFTQEDFNRLAALGANYVNLSHTGIFSETPPYGLDQAVLDNLETLVNMIGQADMFVVISFRTGPGRSEFTFFWGEDEPWFDDSYYNDTVWTTQAAQDAWAAMWRETARRFADNAYVVGYDLMVEPNVNDVFFDIWEPGEFYPRYTGTLFDWNQFHPRLSAAIREEDTKTPILTGCLSYSAVGWLPYLETTDDARTVYTVHQYAPHFYTHQEPGGGVTYPGWMDADYDGSEEYVDKNWLEDLLGRVDNFKTLHNAAVACNEFGVVRWVPGAAVFMEDLMDLLEQRGLNHALWVWTTSYAPYAEEVNAFNFRFGPDPSNTSDVETSELLTVIRSYWSRNTDRPSNCNFVD